MGWLSAIWSNGGLQGAVLPVFPPSHIWAHIVSWLTSYELEFHGGFFNGFAIF
uniref:Uncharacterized protein n=1 Tax=Arundo donax TaxID=35708 RepID=A0A0A9BDG2_ARUDO